MLVGFRVQNFKAFEDTAFIELKPLTLLAGINSAGKSSIFQALLLLKQTLESGPAQVLNPNGPLFVGAPPGFLHTEAGEAVTTDRAQDAKEEPQKPLIYDLSFAYDPKDNLLNLLQAAFPGVNAAPVHPLSCDLRLTFGWGRFGYLKQPSFRMDDLRIVLAVGEHPLLGLDVQPAERGYRVCAVKEATDPRLQTLAFEQLQIDSFIHFLPESFIVEQQQQADPLRDISPLLAQFLRQLFRRIRKDLSAQVSYLSSFRRPPGLSYSNVPALDLLSPDGGNFPQVLWQHRDQWVRFEHPDFSEPGRPNEKQLYDAVDWVLRHILGLEQPIKVQPVGNREDILEVQVRTLGAGSTSVSLSDVGLGYNQILPVVIQGLLTPPGGLVIFEQPEIHLHPEVQARLVLFFVGLANAGRRVLVETHSNHMVDHLCLAIAQDAENRLVKDTSVLFVHPPDAQHAGARIELVQIDAYGHISNWPPHFLPDTAALYADILRAGFAKRQAQLDQRDET